MTARPLFVFRLYVADATENSLLAVANLTTICKTYLAGRYEIEIVDVLKDPGLALSERIFMTPTLVRLRPGPTLKIIGSLGDLHGTARALGIESAAA